ncbi:MAG: hypothetical protein Q9218_001629 [Villophora microphyllina]
MAEKSKHALVFGASGNIGWGVVDQLLSNYPAPGTFSEVTALVNRPLELKDSFWPTDQTIGPKLQLVSGVNLVEGTVESVAELLRTNVKDIENVTHVFYFVYKSEPDLKAEARVTRRMLEVALGALEPLSSRLEFVVFPSGTKEYGIHIPGGIFKAPYAESMGPLPDGAHDSINYPGMREALTRASAGKQWTWCDIRPDAVIGFVPNGSAFNLTAHWANYLSLYTLVENKGAKVPFPGTPKAYNSLYNEASADIIAKGSIWAALHPEKTSGQIFNIADQAKPESMKERWPELAAYFGLEGVGPEEGNHALKPSEYIAKHSTVLEEAGVESSPVFKGEFLDSYGYYLDFDRHMSLEKLRKAGFAEEIDPNQSWFRAFDRYKKAGMLPSGTLALNRAGAALVNPRREFRLLVLFPGEATGELHGELVKASINDDNIHYTALSYTWGDPGSPGAIALNGGHMLSITRNLESALRQFRSRAEKIQLWVDAICINQLDDEEKSFQVGMMRSIYVSACRTWVWLGTSDPTSDNAMDTVQAFQYEDLTSDELRLLRREAWDGIGNLMRRSWWTRIWVVQEVLSSRKVYVWCGFKKIDFECFVKLEEIRRNFAFRLIPTQPFANILSNWTLNQSIVTRGGAPLFEWMADTHKFESTLRRDRIYAMLGLSSEDSRGAIVPDYTDRTSDSLLSTRATAHFLMQQKRLLPLQSGYYRKADDLNLPSWVSDWSTSQAGYVTLVFESEYNACGKYTTMTPRFSPDVKHPSSLPEDAFLILEGVIEDEVKIAEPMPEVPLYTGTDTNEDLKSRMLRRDLTRSTCGRWETIHDSHVSGGHTGFPPDFKVPENARITHTGFWRTVIADRLLDGTGPPGSEYSKHFEDWQAGIDSEGATDFRNAAVSHCAGRSFILTDGGRPGLAPKTTQPGDLICLLHGADVPFVLRRSGIMGTREGCYTFVGEAYVHGVMQGEYSYKLGREDLQRSFKIM